MPLNEWSIGQLIETYYLACREIWRENAMKISLAGGKPGKEPVFRPRKSARKGDKSTILDGIRKLGR